MVVLQSQGSKATANQFIPIGVDVGNGFIKLVGSSNQSIIPSIIKQVNCKHASQYEYSASSKGGVVEYLEGEREDMIGTAFLVGFPAYMEFPEACERISDDRSNKVKYALQALLGALASSSLQSSMKLAICCSIHDAESYSDEVRNALNGDHVVRINGYQTNLAIKTICVDEGLGALASANARGLATLDQRNILLDLGHGTSIIQMFDGTKLVKESRYIHRVGVAKLVQMIADHPATRKFEGGVSGDTYIISKGIQDGSFRYGSQSFCFDNIYREILPQWVGDVLAPTWKQIQPYLAMADRCLACGGGSQLPGIANLLSKKQISILNESQFSNALGLYQLAKGKVNNA